MIVVVLRTRLLVAVSSFVPLPIDLVLGCSVPCCCRSACFWEQVWVLVVGRLTHSCFAWRVVRDRPEDAGEIGDPLLFSYLFLPLC